MCKKVDDAQSTKITKSVQIKVHLMTFEGCIESLRSTQIVL